MPASAAELVTQARVGGSAVPVKVKILGQEPPLHVMEYATSAAVQLAEVTVNLSMSIELEASPTVYVWSAGAVPVAIETSVAVVQSTMVLSQTLVPAPLIT